MSNLSSLLQSDGVQLGEPAVFEHVTDTDMANLLAIAMEDAMVEGLTDLIEDEQECGNTVGEGTIMEGVAPEDQAILEVSIVRLDKKAKKQRAYKMAILQCAKDDDNKDYKKLETLWRMEKFLFRKLEKKYMQRARSRMKQTGNKVKSGNNPIIKRAGSNLRRGGQTRSQRETAKALAGQTKPPSQIKSQFNSIQQKLAGKIK